MTLHLIPTGNIGLNELVALAVQRIYGHAAVAPAEVYELTDGKLEVVRAGNRTSYATDIGHWESVSETIRGDLAVGAAASFVEDNTGAEKRISTTYWDCGAAWRTMITGIFEYESDPAVHRRAVYLRETDGSDLIRRMQHTPEESAASDKDSRQKGPTPAPTSRERDPKRDTEAEAKLRARIESVLAIARRIWRVSKKRPEIDVMAKELERLHGKKLEYKFEAIRKILKGTYSVSVRLKIPGL